MPKPKHELTGRPVDDGRVLFQMVRRYRRLLNDAADCDHRVCADMLDDIIHHVDGMYMFHGDMIDDNV